jgi:hypothetical protein
MRHRIEHDHRALRHLQRKDRPFARRQVDDLECDLPQHFFRIGRQIDRRTPEHLPIIFGRRQLIGAMGRYFSHTRAYRKSHLDQIVERRLIARRAERAIVLRVVQRLQVLVGGEHAGAARAHHAPCHFHDAERHGMQQRRDHPLLAESSLAREVKRVHSVQGMIRSLPHHALEHIDNGFVGRLAQRRKQGFGFAHAAMLHEERPTENPPTDAAEYDYEQDHGHRNIGGWIDQAAKQAGRR